MEFYKWVFLYYILINLTAASLYFVDKKKAQRDSRRIPEKTLIALAVFGGGAGAYLSMWVFHHKTRKRRFYVWVPVWLAVHIALIIFVTFQNNHLLRTHYSYDSKGISCRIVQVSDLHNAYLWFDGDYIVDAVKAEEPDLIVLTGDLVDSNHTDIEKAISQAKGFAEIAPTYYITGNHEYFLSEGEREELFLGLREAGVVLLFDAYVMLEGYGDPFALIGMDDKSLTGSKLRELTGQIKAEHGDCTTVLLAHEPQYLSDYEKAGADLVLAGHAHGGQVSLFGKRALVAPDQGFFPRYARGEYHEGKTTMFLSAGIGNSVIPVRLFDYPEIVVVDMQ